MPLYSLEISEFNNLSIFGQNMFKIKPLNIKQTEDNNITVYFIVSNLGDKNKEVNFLQVISMGIENKKSLVCYDKKEQKKYDMIIINNKSLLDYYTELGVYYYKCKYYGDFSDDDNIKTLKVEYGFKYFGSVDEKYLLKCNKYYTDDILKNPNIKLEPLNYPKIKEEINNDNNIKYEDLLC